MIVSLIPYVEHCGVSPSAAIVPVYTNNLTGVYSVSLKMYYVNTVINYNSCSVEPIFSAPPPIFNNYIIYPTISEFAFSWYSTTPLNLGTEFTKLFTLNFTYLSGTTYLSWDTETAGFCEYGDLNGNILPAIFIDGSVK